MFTLSAGECFNEIACMAFNVQDVDALIVGTVIQLTGLPNHFCSGFGAYIITWVILMVLGAQITN